MGTYQQQHYHQEHIRWFYEHRLHLVTHDHSVLVQLGGCRASHFRHSHWRLRLPKRKRDWRRCRHTGSDPDMHAVSPRSTRV